MALTQLWLISSPTPTWGCPIPRGRHELAVTDHTAPPTWVQIWALLAVSQHLDFTYTYYISPN